MRLSLFFGAILCANAQVDVLTDHNDSLRTSANLRESILNVSNVSPATFGKLFSVDLDGQVFAQPLVVSGIEIPDMGARDVTYVATMHNSVYAIDIATGAVIWQKNLGPSIPAADFACRDIQNEVGILSTPVIDRTLHTIFAVASTVEEGVYHYRLHALDLATGSPNLGSPVEVTGPGFDPIQQWQRPGLLLSQGVVYIGFGSHCDSKPYNGWIIGYSAEQGMPQFAFVNLAANGSGASVWQSGRGLAADEFGTIYAVTGNGDFDGAVNFGETVLAFGPGLNVSDWFVPDGWDELNENDRDLGTSGAALVPNSNLLVTGTKDGRLFVLNRNGLGNFAANNTQVVQEFHAIGFGVFTFAMWPRDSDSVVYIQGNNDVIKAYSLGATGFDTNPMTMGARTTGIPYQGMAISANGSDPASAILWVSSPDDGMHAYAAADLQTELWNTFMMSDRDSLGSFTRFVSPTVANGRVIIGTSTRQLLIYGLLSSGDAQPNRIRVAPPRGATGRPSSGAGPEGRGHGRRGKSKSGLRV